MKKIKEFITRNIAGECILVPTGATAKEFNGMISLSPSGEFIWEKIEKAESFEDLIALITQEFDVPDEIARKETSEFITNLLSKNLISPTNVEAGW